MIFIEALSRIFCRFLVVAPRVADRVVCNIVRGEKSDHHCLRDPDLGGWFEAVRILKERGKDRRRRGNRKQGGGEKAAGETGDSHGRRRGFAGYESISEEIRLVVRLGNGESEYGLDQREGDLAVLLGDAAPDTLLGIHFRHQDGCSVDERADWALHRNGLALPLEAGLSSELGG